MNIRRSYDRFISTMGFPILVRWHLYIESGPSSVYQILFVIHTYSIPILRRVSVSCELLITNVIYYVMQVRPYIILYWCSPTQSIHCYCKIINYFLTDLKYHGMQGPSVVNRWKASVVSFIVTGRTGVRHITVTSFATRDDNFAAMTFSVSQSLYVLIRNMPWGPIR